MRQAWKMLLTLKQTSVKKHFLLVYFICYHDIGTFQNVFEESMCARVVQRKELQEQVIGHGILKEFATWKVANGDLFTYRRF